MKGHHIKLVDGVLRGTLFPKHLQIAYGRWVCRLHYLPADRKGRPSPSIFLRDLPASLADLAHNYGYWRPLQAFRQECDRLGIPKSCRLFDDVDLLTGSVRQYISRNLVKTEKVMDSKNHNNRRVQIFLLHKGCQTIAQLEIVEGSKPQLKAVAGSLELAKIWERGILAALDSE